MLAALASQPVTTFSELQAVGFRIARFEVCSAFTRVAAHMLAESPMATRFIEVASHDLVTSFVRSDCYRLERQLPCVVRTH